MRGVGLGFGGCWGWGVGVGSVGGRSSFFRRSGSFVGRTTSGLGLVSVMPDVADFGACFGMRLSRTIFAGGVAGEFLQEV